MTEPDTAPQSDLDSRYARGEIARSEYLEARRTFGPASGPSITTPSGLDRRRGIALAALGLAVVVILAVGLWAAFAPRTSFGPASVSPPRQLSQAEVDALLASPGDYEAYPANNTAWVHGDAARLVMLASPMAHDEAFVVGDLVNPRLDVGRGMQVTLTVINMDAGMVHNWAITTRGPPYGSMGMMSGGGMGMPTTAMMSPASGGMYWAQDITFTGMASGQYWYLCQYPGHAADGMYGALVVS